MTHDEAIKKIREGLKIADKFCGNHTANECPDTVAIPIKDALAAIDSLAVELSECLYTDNHCPGYPDCTYPEKDTHEGQCALSPQSLELDVEIL